MHVSRLFVLTTCTPSAQTGCMRLKHGSLSPTNPSCAPSVTVLLPFQIDLEVADREVDRLEHTVASLRDQLQEARGGSDGDSVGGGRDDSSGSTEGKSECTLLSTNTPGDQHEVREQRNGSPVAYISYVRATTGWRTERVGGVGFFEST